MRLAKCTCVPGASPRGLGAGPCGRALELVATGTAADVKAAAGDYQRAKAALLGTPPFTTWAPKAPAFRAYRAAPAAPG